VSAIQKVQLLISAIALTLALINALHRRRVRDLLTALIILMVFNILFLIWRLDG
jgi:hypothetical protein